MNRNAATARRLVERHGGAIIAIREGGKHAHMQVRTALGAVFWLAVSKGTGNDRRKLVAWVGQAIRRADKAHGKETVNGSV